MLQQPRKNLRVRRRNGLHRQAQDRIKPRHWVEAPIETEDVLIQVRLQVLRLDTPVMRSHDPRLQVRDDAVDDGKMLLGLFRIARENQRLVLV